jgi:sortase A
MKKRLPSIILVAILLLGLSLLLYPTISSRWNQMHQTRAISQYSEVVEELDDDQTEELWAAAVAYNTALAQTPTQFNLSEEKLAEYESILNVTEDGLMGYIEIPTIDCYLPIYHGTEETTLLSGVGHLTGSSFPVGGESTHCVLSGHRGLPSAKLFTDLNQLSEGDIFLLHVLDETLTYEVDQILIVEPDQIESLSITQGEDLCTLVTCTPYGINTHRLLVRGHRIETEEDVVERKVVSNAVQVDTMLVASVLAVPLVILTSFLLIAQPPTRRKKKPKPRRLK